MEGHYTTVIPAGQASPRARSREREIRRVVQVVEAYPDTGRRVFQTVLTEFEKFLDHYFQQENEVSRKGVSLAQQVEQRETLAIQYTIDNDLPSLTLVHKGNIMKFTEGAFRDDLLGDLSVADLLILPISETADHWRSR